MIRHWSTVAPSPSGWTRRRLTLGITHEIIGAQVSLENEADNEVLPALLNPLRRRGRQISADGAYNTKACHKLLRQKQAKPTIPPHSNAGYRETGYPRNEAEDALKAGELEQLKLTNKPSTFLGRDSHVPLQTTYQSQIEFT